MRKLPLIFAGLALVVALAVAGIASGATPKPLGFYCSKYDCLQVDKKPTSINNFQGRCTAVKHPKFYFEVFAGIPIDKKGKFSYDAKNAVNTPDGGTLSKEYRVTIDGKFVSKSEAKGTYQLHKAGCKKVSFDAKLSKGG
jgi:hypothetical protein